MKKLWYITIFYSHIESYEHLNRNHRAITRDPPTFSINILRDCLKDSCYDHLCGHLPTGSFAVICCREAYNSENRADQLSLLKMYIFSREYTASVLPFLSQTTLQLRIIACSAILNQIQSAFLFLLLASTGSQEH